MERLEHYRQCIRKLLTEEATLEEGNPDIECQLVFDEEAILEQVRTLPLDRQQQVLDFVEFLQSKSPELKVTATVQPETPMADADTPQGKGWPPGFFEETFGSCKDGPLMIDSEGIFEDRN